MRLSTVVAALSRALDLTEGQAEGHAQRTLLIGMCLADSLGIDAAQRTALFYALLLKDAGCTASASRTAALFAADDIALRRDGKLVDWHKSRQVLTYLIRHTAREARGVARMGQALSVARTLKSEGHLIVEARCHQGASIVRSLGLDPAASEAVRDLDEHWDGGGHPRGLAGHQIGILARIGCVAQTAEVFVTVFGRDAARRMVAERTGRWFDPEVAGAFLGISDRHPVWEALTSPDLTAAALRAQEPGDMLIEATEERLDRVADAFALVIDAKSPWTNRHSHGVAHWATELSGLMGMSPEERPAFRRCALLHDIGKLAVSSRILDKPGPLSASERVQVERHAATSEHILAQVPTLANWAATAGAHHERLDGTGYHRGLTAGSLTPAMRALAVADVYDALTATRPYRAPMDRDEALALIANDRGKALCPTACDALTVVTKTNHEDSPSTGFEFR